MDVKKFLSQIDDQQLVKTIDAAERQSSGEIVVYVEENAVPDARHGAEAQFGRLALERTQKRNAVLIYLVPATQQLAVYGDEGIHKICGESYWQEVVEEMTPLLQKGEFTRAIVGAIEKIGATLAIHFPPETDNPNELPNTVRRN